MSIKKTFLLILLYSFCYAQQTGKDKDTVYTLEPVVISARSENSILNLPYAINLVDSTKINNKLRGISLNEILNNVPGLIVSNRNNPSLGDRITLRGIGTRASFGIRGIKINYDGIPLTFADGQSELTNLDFSSIGKIEVLHGPASSLYGNASGGVINFISENPSDKPISLSTSFTGGSFDLRIFNLRTSGTLNNFSYLLSLNKTLYRGFREHSEKKSFSLNSILNYRFSNKLKVKTIINYFNSPYALNPSSLNRNDALNSPKYSRPYIVHQGAGEKTWQVNYGLSFNFLFEENFTNTTTIYFIRRSLINPIPGTIINLDRSAGGLRTFFEKKFLEIFPDVNFTLNGGLDFEFQNDKRKEFENLGLPDTDINPENIFKNLQYGNIYIDQKESVKGAAPFVSAGFLFKNKFQLQTGFRFDNYTFKVNDNIVNNGNSSGEISMNSFSPMIGIIYHPLSYYKIYANYSTSFQTPTTNELSNNPSGAGGFNKSLEPEKIKSYEIGTSGIFISHNLNFTADCFLMDFQNILISYQSSEAGNEEIFYKNAGRARNIGAEINLNWNPISEITVSASYTKMYFVFKDYLAGFINNLGEYTFKQLKGNFVPGVPQNFSTFEVEYKAPFSFYVNLESHWHDKYFVNDFNGPLPGFRTPSENYINNSYLNLNCFLGYKFRYNDYELRLSMGIENLFDKRYSASVVPNAAVDRFFEPSPGRNFYFKVALRL